MKKHQNLGRLNLKIIPIMILVILTAGLYTLHALNVIAPTGPNEDTSNDSGRTVEEIILDDVIPQDSYLRETSTRAVLMSQGKMGSIVKLEAKTPCQRLETIAVLPGIGTIALFFPEYIGIPFSETEQKQGDQLVFKGVDLPWSAGAEHQYIGHVNLTKWDINSDKNYPLTFKVVKDRGYVRLCGKGTIARMAGQARSVGKYDTVKLWVKEATSADQLRREGAAQALGYLAAEASTEEKGSAVAVLSALLSDPVYEVRRNATEALGKIGGAVAVSELKRIAEKDPNEDVKQCAKWALETAQTN
jgi:hypothetical protein